MALTFITQRPFWSPWGIEALSLHCLCLSSLTLNERLDGQSFVWTLSDMGLLVTERAFAIIIIIIDNYFNIFVCWGKVPLMTFWSFHFFFVSLLKTERVLGVIIRHVTSQLPGFFLHLQTDWEGLSRLLAQQMETFSLLWITDMETENQAPLSMHNSLK